MSKSKSSKNFGGGAFQTLKTLQDRHRELDDAKAQEQRRQDEENARKQQERLRETRDLRFTEDDLFGSDLSDEEIFAASMRAMDSQPLDLYQSKFNAREHVPKPSQKPEPAPLTMTDEEREFAIFTQEMALANVQRLVSPPKKSKNRTKKSVAQNSDQASEMIELSSVKIDPVPVEPGMKTDFLAHDVAVTQVEKGGDITQNPEPADTMTAAQKKLLKDVHHYESRYGMLMTLRLRGLTLNAAISRLDDFIAACIRERRPYAHIICGKGIHSADRPVIKEYTIDILRNDARVTEYAPILDEDGDFGALYAAFKLKNSGDSK